MFPGVDDSLKQALFSAVVAPNEAWIGAIYSLQPSEQELIPLQFGGNDYWIGFTSPHFETVHDIAFLQQSTAAWAGGFIPAMNSRLLKLARADAVQSHFDPTKWKLSNAGQIYQFSQTLGDAIVFHAQTYPDCEQYFFNPTDDRVALLYKRTCRYVFEHCVPGQFEPILPNLTGDFIGYRRI